jgi:hypothetical protein
MKWKEGQTPHVPDVAPTAAGPGCEIALDNPLAQCYNPYDSGCRSPCEYAYPCPVEYCLGTRKHSERLANPGLRGMPPQAAAWLGAFRWLGSRRPCHPW